MSELDAILEEVKKGKYQQEIDFEAEEPSKTWSLEDIDRLIAGASGEEYIPEEKSEPTPAKDFERVLNREFDTGLFTIKPMESVEREEMQDISSDSGLHEVEGQETFFGEEEIDESIFEIETVIVPEDVPEPSSSKFEWQRAAEIAEAKEKELHKIKPFYEGDKPASEFFEKKEEKPEANEKISEEDYRTRFFSKLKLERTAEVEIEPDGPVDKSGIVIAKPEGASSETGLDLLPKVLAAESLIELEDEKTRIVKPGSGTSKPAKTYSDDVDGQIMLTGFDEIIDESAPDQTSETDVETTLWEKRKKKAKAFRIVDTSEIDNNFEGEYEAPPEEIEKEEKALRKKQKKLAEQQEEEEKFVAEEYTAPSERARIHTRLGEFASKATVGIAVIGAIELVMIVLNILPSIVTKLDIESTFFAAGSVGLNVANAVLLIAVAAINNVRFVDGFVSAFKRNFTSDSAVSLAIAIALLQNTLAAVIGGSGLETAVFSMAAVFGVLIQKVTEKMNAQRILGNFEVCAYKYEHNMYAVHPFENESEIFELGRGLMMGNADLLYSSKLAFPSDFIKNSGKSIENKKLLNILIPVAFGASAVAGVLAGIMNKSVMTGFAAFTATFCVTSPIFTSFVPAFIERITNRELNATGTMIAGMETVEKTAGANAVVMDSADIFDRSQCTMHGMKNFENIRIDDVLLYATALVIKSGGPLRECFEQVVDGRQDILPPVKELVYEDKLGIAARIHNQPVLLGNRNLLVHHNIEVPEKSLEERYSHSGRKVMYLAVAGKIAALFVVSYAVDKNLEPYFRQLEANGIQVLVRTNDVNVTEELIAKSFGLPQETFKVLSSVAGRLFKRRRDAVCDKLPAGIVHDGTAFSMLRAVAAACSVSTAVKLGSIVQIILSVLGFILCTALYCTSLGSVVTGLSVLVLLAVELAIHIGIMFLGKIK